MTNAFCLVGSYITAGPMCLCLTNRLCVLKQQTMARVMTNCINKTFITLNILATKSQLPRSTSEHPAPPPHSYSLHTMSPMHKLAVFCHTGGLAGWELVCLARDEKGTRWWQMTAKLLQRQINRKSFSFSLCVHLSYLCVWRLTKCVSVYTVCVCVCASMQIVVLTDWCTWPALY